MSDNNLKNCPCGAAAEVAITKHKAQRRYWGRCTKKHCAKQPDCFEVLSEAQAIEEWNISVEIEQELSRR